MSVVKRALTLLLLLGAMIGLFGQAAAYAAFPSMSAATAANADMSADCMAMMANAPISAKKPCTGLTLDCITAMGCTVQVTLAEPFILSAAAQAIRAVPPMLATRPLTTRVVAPDPEPPSRI